MRLSGVLLVLAALAALAAVACTTEVVKEVEVPGETIIVEKEVVKEVPVQVVVEKEVVKVKEVEVQVVVEKEVVVEVVKEVVVEVIKEVIKEVVVERIVEVEAMAEMTYQEAPMLAQLVASGLLDPVEDRLPSNPYVATVEEIGVYGGSLTRAYFCPGDVWNLKRYSRTAPARFTTDGAGVFPWAVAGWEVSNGGKTWTFEIRDGMRWSDGEPATMEDIKFAFFDVSSNEVLFPTAPGAISLEGQLPEFKEIDDLHFSLTYHKPFYSFAKILPQTDMGGDRMFQPAHYLKQFHEDYADAFELQAIVDAGPNLDANQIAFTHKSEWDGWRDAFLHHYHAYFEDTNFPVLDPWILKTRYGVQRMIAERNPYYWGVDQAGNQLPYIDRLIFNCVENAEVVQLKAIAGELTAQGRHIKMSSYPILQENRAKGNYSVKLWPNFGGTDSSVALNQNWKGPEGEYFRNVDFRRALSVAVNRDLINEVAYLGTGTPRTPMPPPGHPEHPGVKYEKAWTNYEPELAMQMLDAIMPDKDGDGFRLMSNGERFSLEIGMWDGFGGWLDSTEMAILDWEAVGIHATMTVMHRAAHGIAWGANELMAQPLRMSSAGFTFADANPQSDVKYGHFSPLWSAWIHSGGTEGEEPPAQMKAYHEKHLLGRSLPPEEANELAKEIYREYADGVFLISFVGMTPVPVVVSNNIGNYPDFGYNYWPLRTPGNAMPEQLFLRQR
jgi:peptide/nickel transport system substrate-binding protein